MSTRYKSPFWFSTAFIHRSVLSQINLSMFILCLWFKKWFWALRATMRQKDADTLDTNYSTPLFPLGVKTSYIDSIKPFSNNRTLNVFYSRRQFFLVSGNWLRWSNSRMETHCLVFCSIHIYWGLRWLFGWNWTIRYYSNKVRKFCFYERLASMVEGNKNWL